MTERVGELKNEFNRNSDNTNCSYTDTTESFAFHGYVERKLLSLANELRTFMTQEERKLWERIGNNQIKGNRFCRQTIIGNYIVDFYCPSAKLVIEVDGSHHDVGDTLINDQYRDEYLRNHGLRVIRVSNQEVNHQIDEVLLFITDHF
ncbi:MAG: endonuclease domain-containing protein [Dehalogenimonas sp.]